MNNYYVYLHRKATNGEVFYVGKGSGNRAWSKGNRSKFWKDTANKYGFTVEIYIVNVQEWYAYEVERELIAYYGRRDKGTGTLVNMTNGGGGKYSEYDDYKRERLSNLISESKKDKNKYSFTNVYTEVTEICTKSELQEKYGLPVGNIGRLFNEELNCKQNRVSVCGWVLTENYEEYKKYILKGFAGEYNPNADNNTYTFYNYIEDDTFIGTRLSFCEYSGLNRIEICQFFSKDQVYTLRGWCIPELLDEEKFKLIKQYKSSSKGLLNPNSDKTEYHFKNFNKDWYVGTRCDFKIKYGFDPYHLFSLSHPSMVQKGWYLAHNEDIIRNTKKYRNKF